MNRSRTIVVTGATGFIGRHVVARLVGDGHRVRALVRGRGSSVSGAEVWPFDGLQDRDGMAAAMDGADLVVHLAARVHVMRETAGDPLSEHRRVNVDGTAALLTEAARAGVRRLISASSVKAMGEGTSEPWTEETRAAPVDAYGISKLEAERLALEWAGENGREVAVLRLPLVYGPGMRGNMLRLFALVDRGWPLPLGRIRNRRSLLYVGNLAAAVSILVASESMGRGTYLLSDGHDLGTPELIRMIGRALGRTPRLLPVPHALFTMAGRFGDGIARIAPFPLTTASVQRLVGSLVVDSSRFHRTFGFEPPYSVADALSATAQWYRDGRAHERRHARSSAISTDPGDVR